MISTDLKFDTEQGKYWYHEMINKLQITDTYIKNLFVELANYKFPATEDDCK